MNMEVSVDPPTIAILLHHSLLAMGIASRLREQAETANVQIIDVDSEVSDIQGMITSQTPEIIILDAGDSEVCQKITITKLFEWAPTAKIICLDNSSERVRFFFSTEMTVSCTSELMKIIQNFPQID